MDETEQTFLKGAELFWQARLDEIDRVKALGILESFCEKSGRIFIRMLLLPSLMELDMGSEGRCSNA